MYYYKKLVKKWYWSLVPKPNATCEKADRTKTYKWYRTNLYELATLKKLQIPVKLSRISVVHLAEICQFYDVAN